MKDKLVLANKAEIETDAMSSIGSITVKAAAVTEIQVLKDKLTAENLKSVQCVNAAGTTVGSYENLVLIDTWSIKWIEAGGFELSFGLREKTEIEKLRDEVVATQAVQDGAIEDLGIAVSDISTSTV